ncbi:MAG: hypothetical protein EXS43_10170 [Opitutus sp.]|nr:hypothetical protein [Opitutus sp.]
MVTGLLALAIACASPARAAETELFVPRFKTAQVLLTPADHAEQNYYLTPNLVRVSDREVLITFKRGSSHGWEAEADAGLLRFDTVANRVVEDRTIGHLAGRKFQLTMGTIFGDGALGMFTDLQTTGDDGRHYRAGMRSAFSSDRGATFGPWQELGQINGVEYGYPFDFIVEGNTAYMLAMVFGYRPGARWSVDVLKSTDHGRSWGFIRNLKQEFGGFPINESGFVRHGAGFIVATRGYDHAVRLQHTDGEFRLQRQVDLTQTCAYVKDSIGWPRLFTRDGRYYLLGRNWTETPATKLEMRPAGFPGIPDNQQLCLLRFDPDTLAVERVVVLDNDGGHLPVIDGYYGVPYWQEREGRVWFDTITYRAIGLNQPSLVRLEFDWNEVR